MGGYAATTAFIADNFPLSMCAKSRGNHSRFCAAFLPSQYTFSERRCSPSNFLPQNPPSTTLDKHNDHARYRGTIAIAQHLFCTSNVAFGQQREEGGQRGQEAGQVPAEAKRRHRKP